MTTPGGDMVRDDLDMIMARLLGDHTAYSCDESRGVKLARSGIGVLKRTVPTSDTVRYQWYRADWQSEMWYHCLDEKKCPCAEAGVHCTDKCHV